jgi:hypothetical protein
MALKWSCFLSFRGGAGALATEIVDKFVQALTNELGMQTDAGLYRYTDQMVAGDFIDPTIADELRASACMIALFTGKYFSKARSYCAREYLAMSRLEKDRLKRLSAQRPATKGLIVPVILRNPDRFPPVLKTRFMFDFTGFGQNASGLDLPEGFFQKVRKIAEYASDRHAELESIVEDDEEMQLPDDDEVKTFLATLDSSLASRTPPPKRPRK